MMKSLRVGIIGGGQLAQMLALAGRPLGIDIVCLAEDIDCPAASVAMIIPGSVDKPESLQQFLKQVDIISFEFENVNIAPLQSITQQVAIFPSLTCLNTAQDRLLEKQCFNDLAIPTTRFYPINSQLDLTKAAAELGFPCVLKTRCLGYDGKGQMVLRDASDIETAWQLLGTQTLILEEFIAFEQEVSLIAVRNQQGEIRCYPLTENQHEAGILRVSRAPYHMPVLQQQAENYVTRLLEKFNYIGVLTVEFFQKANQLIANEMAPRVHNSGHWTIEGATISQFENHLRAITGLPLGDTAAIGYSAMINLIGEMPTTEKILALPSAHFHYYAKEPRPGRKLGHITVCANNAVTREELVVEAQRNLHNSLEFLHNLR